MSGSSKGTIDECPSLRIWRVAKALAAGADPADFGLPGKPQGATGQHYRYPGLLATAMEGIAIQTAQHHGTHLPEGPLPGVHIPDDSQPAARPLAAPPLDGGTGSGVGAPASPGGPPPPPGSWAPSPHSFPPNPPWNGFP